MNGGTGMATTTHRNDEGAMLTPEEVAQRLGVKRDKVYGWIEAEELEAMDLRSAGATLPRWKVSERALRKFLDQRSTQ